MPAAELFGVGGADQCRLIVGIQYIRGDFIVCFAGAVPPDATKALTVTTAVCGDMWTPFTAGLWGPGNNYYIILRSFLH